MDRDENNVLENLIPFDNFKQSLMCKIDRCKDWHDFTEIIKLLSENLELYVEVMEKRKKQ